MTLETLPSHFPLPTKLRYEILDPIELDHDPERAKDDEYVNGIYDEVEWTAAGRRQPARRAAPVPGLRLTVRASPA